MQEVCRREDKNFQFYLLKKNTIKNLASHKNPEKFEQFSWKGSCFLFFILTMYVHKLAPVITLKLVLFT